MSASFSGSDSFPFTRRHDGSVVIRVIGVGGAGCNAVARMHAEHPSGVECIITNTDAQMLLHSPVERRVRLGETLTRGMGAGGDPSVGARAAQESLEELRMLLRGSDLVFVTAGMGGGTGTGAAPIIAHLARELGALTVGIVSYPFRFEGARRATIANQGIEMLRNQVDTLIVVPNERLLTIVDQHQPFTEALHIGDDILRQGVRGISDLITTPGLINLDFADVRAIIANAGSALMAIGEGQGTRRASEAIQHAVASPLLERDIRGAQRILLNITGGEDLTLMEVSETASLVQSLAHPNATIIFGTVQAEQMEGRMRVTLIAAGFSPVSSTTHPVSDRAHAQPGGPTRPLLNQPQPDADRWLIADQARVSDEPTMALPSLPLRSSPGASHADVLPDDPEDNVADDGETRDVPAFLRR
jgi:cell division protein FtsZ